MKTNVDSSRKHTDELEERTSYVNHKGNHDARNQISLPDTIILFTAFMGAATVLMAVGRTVRVPWAVTLHGAL